MRTSIFCLLASSFLLASCESGEEMTETTKNSFSMAGAITDDKLSNSSNKALRRSGKTGAGSMIAAIPEAIDKANQKVQADEAALIAENLRRTQELLLRNEKLESEIESKKLTTAYLHQTDEAATISTDDGIHLSSEDTASFITLVLTCENLDNDSKGDSQHVSVSLMALCGERELSNGVRAIGNPIKNSVFLIGEKNFAIAKYGERSP